MGVAVVTSAVPVKLQFTFVIPPHRTANGDVHTVLPLRKQDVSGNDPFCAEWVKCEIAAHGRIPVTFLQTSRYIEHHWRLADTVTSAIKQQAHKPTESSTC